MASNLTLWSQHKRVYAVNEVMKKQPKCLSLLFIWNNLMLDDHFTLWISENLIDQKLCSPLRENCVYVALC